jgi:hypothetical protein
MNHENETLPVHVFRDSFGPFIALLKEHQIQFMMREARSATVMASSGIIELLQTAALWGALAAVVVAYIRARASRKVIITTKDNTVVHAEGLSVEEVERVLRRAKSLTVIETERQEPGP